MNRINIIHYVNNINLVIILLYLNKINLILDYYINQ